MAGISRLARKPIEFPADIEVTLKDHMVIAKGKAGVAELTLHPSVEVVLEGKSLKVKARDGATHPMIGTTCALLRNLIKGMSQGFTKVLELEGVGYRAAVTGNTLDLSLGYSHPVQMPIPTGLKVVAETTSKLRIEGKDKEAVGLFAAEVKDKRPVEPYKGKGLRYSGQKVELKETKKK